MPLYDSMYNHIMVLLLNFKHGTSSQKYKLASCIWCFIDKGSCECLSQRQCCLYYIADRWLQLGAIACYSTKEALIGTFFWGISKFEPRNIHMIFLLSILVLCFTWDSCKNKDILLILGYNYNIAYHSKMFEGNSTSDCTLTSLIWICMYWCAP